MSQYLELDAKQADQMIKLFDKKDKLPAEDFTLQARRIFTSETVEVGMDKFSQLIKAKSLADLPESLKESQAVKEVQVLFTLLSEHQIKAVTFDITLMRGFDYYTDIVFEVFDKDPENNRAMFGGGRYDGLVGAFGVEPVATVGFGMGDITTENFLASHNLLPKLKPASQLYVVTIGGVLKEGQEVVRQLREKNINVAVDLTDRKPEKQIKTALKLGVPYLLFIGEDELKAGKYILRNVETQAEDTLTVDETVKAVK